MPHISSPSQQHRHATGNHITWQDKKQGAQNLQNERVSKLARQPGLHSNNYHRQLTAQSMISLISILSSVQNSAMNSTFSAERRAENFHREKKEDSSSLLNTTNFERQLHRPSNANTVKIATVSSPAINNNISRIDKSGSCDDHITISDITSEPASICDNFSGRLNSVCNMINSFPPILSGGDFLQFRTANAAALPEKEANHFNALESLGNGHYYTISDETDKIKAISAIKNALVSAKKITYQEGQDLELLLREVSAEAPVIIAPLDTTTLSSVRNNDDVDSANYSPESLSPEGILTMAVEEKVLNAYGEKIGKIILLRTTDNNIFSQSIQDGDNENINNKSVDVSPESTNVIIFGIDFSYGKMIAEATRHTNADNLFDDKKNYDISTLLNLDGRSSLQNTSRAAHKPAILQNTIPLPQRAAFYTIDQQTGIRKEILIILKEGDYFSGGINVNRFLIPTKVKNEFDVLYEHTGVGKKTEKVIFNENDNTWKYKGKLDEGGLKVEIMEGNSQVELHGECYEITKDDEGFFFVKTKTESGITEYIPVHQEPLSKAWSLTLYNGHKPFDEKHESIIKKISIPYDKNFNYFSSKNNNPVYYGSGIIYQREKIGDASGYKYGLCIEMFGNLIPVRYTQHKNAGAMYEAYDINHPENEGFPVEFTDNHWFFERETSPHVSPELALIVTPEMLSNVDVKKLSAPGHIGLRVNEKGEMYIKVNGGLLKIEQQDDLVYIFDGKGNKINIKYNNKDKIFYIMSSAEKK